MDNRVEAPPIWHYTINGRYGRTNFVNASIIIFLVAMALYILLEDIFPAAPVIIYVLFVTFYLRAVILRMHDMDFPKLGILPLVLIYALYIPNMFLEDIRAYIAFITVTNLAFAGLALFPGSKGENKYGPHPKTGSTAGVIVTIIGGTALLVMLILSEIPVD